MEIALCHPTAATWTIFEPGTDHLHVICAECEQLITRIAVGERPSGREGDRL